MQHLMGGLRQAARLLKLNMGTLLVFEVIYKLLLILLFRPLVQLVARMALRAQGLSFLSDETVSAFLHAPLSWLLIVIAVLFITAFTLFDICCIIQCFHASYHGQKIPLLALIRKGVQTAFRGVYQGRAVLAIYLLIIIPMTHSAYISGYVAGFSVPQFIKEYIYGHRLLGFAYIAFWIFMALWTFRWLYSLHYFALEDVNFKTARRRSIRLMGKRWQDYVIHVGLVLGWCLALSLLYQGVISLGAILIAKVNSAVVGSAFFSSLTLSGISLLLEICAAAFYIFNLPLFFGFVSLLFYQRKQRNNLKIAPAYTDLDQSYKVSHSAFVKKLYPYRKRLIALALVAVLAVNFAYIRADQGGRIPSTIAQNLEIAAHRGYSSAYPENTIPAFKGAVEVGADWVELDVQQTKDGQLIIMHDSNLKRTTGLDADIWTVDWDQIKDLDNGSWFDPKYKEVRIPTLEEVLDYCRFKIRINIELKPTGHEKDFEKMVVDLVKEKHMEDQVVISSMKYGCIEKVKEIDPDLTTAYITSVSYGDFTILDAADAYSVEETMLTDAFISAAHAAGKAVYVWTLNTEESLAKVMKMDVDMVITDQIALAQEEIYLKEHSDYWDRYIERLLEMGN